MVRDRGTRIALPPTSLLLLTLLYITGFAWGNVEKAIFSAPEVTPLPIDASIDNLYLTSLSPEHPTVRAHLNASFPTESNPKGSISWFLLDYLNPGQRYEVRVCWLATQPTSFWMHTHTFSSTMEDPDLISSLTVYANSRRDVFHDAEVQRLQARRKPVSTVRAESSLLLLQIHAAADYYSLNKTLMENVPPVLADIILDSYAFNVFPQSLIPTACYLMIIAGVAWYLSAWIATRLRETSCIPDDATVVSLVEQSSKKDE